MPNSPPLPARALQALDLLLRLLLGPNEQVEAIYGNLAFLRFVL